jgi:DNA polymerase
MALDNRQKAYLDAMGIDVWVRPQQQQAAEVLTPATVSDDNASPSRLLVNEKNVEVTQLPRETGPTITDVSTLDWGALENVVSGCQLCELSQTRTQAVFGVGNQQADIMLIGEAPGAEEDKQGEPFVGRAGQLLNAMLKAVGFERDEVYIANILKCRPPQNRDPSPEEAAQCWPYLRRQIELVQPKVILALGRIAAQRLLQTNTSLARLRGKLHYLDDISVPVMVTYHPAYLLRAPQEKRKSWEDLRFLVSQL